LWIRRRATEGLLAGALIGHAASPVPIAGPTATPEVLFSSSRRFALRTCERARDAPLLAMLEDVAARLEEALGAPLPAPAGRPWLVIVERDAGAGPPRAVREADLGTRGLGRTLRLVRPEELPPSTILVGIVAGLVARHVAKHQPPAEADSSPRWPPEWLAAGLAGTLYPGPRQAWLRRAADEWSAGQDPPLGQLLAVEIGGADEHMLPFLTALVAWLRRLPSFPRLADHLLRAAAAGTSPSCAELAAAIQPGWSSRDLEQAWDLALASLRRIETPWSEPRPRRIARLRSALLLSPAHIPLMLPPDVSPPLTPRDLVRADGAAWVPPLATQMQSALNRIPLGDDPDLLEVAALYRSVLRSLMDADRSPLDAVVRPLRRFMLTNRLSEAEQRLDDLEALAAAEEELETSPAMGDEVEELIRRDAALVGPVPPP